MIINIVAPKLVENSDAQGASHMLQEQLYTLLKSSEHEVYCDFFHSHPKCDLLLFAVQTVSDLTSGWIKDYASHYSKDCMIGLCGRAPSLEMKYSMMAMECIDFIILGEPEETLLELIKNLQSNKNTKSNFYEIKGLYFRCNNKLIKTEKRIIHRCLDEYPMPEYSYLELGQKFFNVCSLECSRFCYGDCIFCGGNVYRQQNYNNIISVKSAERIFDEINNVITKYNVRFFAFQDDNFFYDGNEGFYRAEKFADLVISQKKRIRFSIQCRASDVSYKLFKHLKKAGLYKVFIGFESGCQDVLDRYNKGTTVDENKEAIEILNNLGINCQPGYIFFDPYTTKRELEETISFFLPYKDKLFSFVNGPLETRYLEFPTGCKAYEIFRHITPDFSMITPETFDAEKYFINSETIDIYNHFKKELVKSNRKGNIFSDELDILNSTIGGY